MIQFIHNDFKLDVTSSNITFIKENHWFFGTLFREYTLPGIVDLTPEWIKEFGFLNHHNSIDKETIYKGHLFSDGDLEIATLELQGLNDNKLKFVIHFGREELPTWNKNLKELDLLSTEVPDIFSHAATIIPQAYPAVNYNFPMIHTDKYDTSDATFAEFLKLLNLYEGSAFVENEVDLYGTIHNRNIMQPFPYLLYVLKMGFEADGFTLVGDILTDPDLLKALVIASVDYFNTSSQEEIEVHKTEAEFTELFVNGNGITVARYNIDVPITEVGQYRIIGNIRPRGGVLSGQSVSIKYGTELLIYQAWYVGETPPSLYPIDIELTITSVDVLDAKVLNIEVETELVGYPGNVIDLNINPIRFHNETGDAVSFIYIPNEINLKNCVPDMLFSNLVKTVMLWKNFDIDFEGDQVRMNYLKNEIKRDEAVQLSEFDEVSPEIKYNKISSYILRYTDAKESGHNYKEVFVNKEGYTSEEYTADEFTKEINIDLLPLPQRIANGVNTSLMVDDDETKLRIAFYNGLVNGKPVCYQNPSVIFPALFELNWLDWIIFRINTDTYIWKIIVNVEKSKAVKLRKLIYAYDNYFIIRKRQKQRIDSGHYEMIVEADKLI